MHVARSIGSNVEIQDRLDRWIAAEGSIAHNVIKEAMKKAYGARRYGLTHKMNKDGYKQTEWENSERVHVGFRMVDIIIQTTGLVKLDTQQEHKRKRATYVVPTDGTMEWVKTSTHGKKPCILVMHRVYTNLRIGQVCEVVASTDTSLMNYRL